MSAQKKNWQIRAQIDACLLFFKFFMREKILIIELKNRIMPSVNIKKRISGNVIKNINPIIRPMIKINRYAGICIVFKISAVFNNSFESSFLAIIIKAILQIKARKKHSTQTIPKAIITESSLKRPVPKPYIKHKQNEYGKTAASINNNFFIDFPFLDHIMRSTSSMQEFLECKPSYPI